jgi:SAM-dependent methyltransferase
MMAWMAILVANPSPRPMNLNDLLTGFTMNHQIPIILDYHEPEKDIVKYYKLQQYRCLMSLANDKINCRNRTDQFLFQFLDSLGSEIKKLDIAVIESQKPWYESILLTYGVSCVVIEPRTVIKPKTLPITYLTPKELIDNPRQFDLVINMYSLARHGFGYKREPMDPDADLKWMNECKTMLKPEGRLVLSIPIGPDAIMWNSHRIYGSLRLKRLLQGWKPIQYYGFNCMDLDTGLSDPPLFILKPKT